MSSTTTIEMFRGDNYSAEITVVDENGTAVDISDSEIVFTVRANLKENSNIEIERKNEKASGDSTQITYSTDGTDGKFKMFLIPTNTNEMRPSKYWFDFQVTLSNNKVYTILKGEFILKSDVTR